MRRLLVLFMIIVSPVLMHAEEASLTFEQANQFYRGGEFQKAAALYEQVEKNGYESPALYYNLGNSYFKLQNIPLAILNYERAQRLAPHDDDISYNLRLANLRIVDKIEPIPELFFISWWRSIVNELSSGGWSAVSIVSLWCTAIGVGVLLISRQFLMQRIALFTACVAFCISILGFTAVTQRMQIERSNRSAILIVPSISIKSAPDEQSTDLFVLHEGVKVEYLDTVGDWKKIRLADGKVGWLHASAAAII